MVGKVPAFMMILFAVIAAPCLMDECGAETNNDSKEPQIIERTIKIEGVVEKPRVLFIVPRAKIWKEYSIKKSFLADILKPVYPEEFLREFVENGTGDNYRR